MDRNDEKLTILDQLTRTAALKLSRRHVMGRALFGGTAAIAIQMLGFPAPSAQAATCNTCWAPFNQCEPCTHTRTLSCCSPGGFCTTGTGQCACPVCNTCGTGKMVVGINVCDDGSWAGVCNSCCNVYWWEEFC